ncbi:MAG: hypothetical protein ACNFW9_06140 [Candidatus Kerfeldbacteria bacterium]
MTIPTINIFEGPDLISLGIALWNGYPLNCKAEDDGRSRKFIWEQFTIGSISSSLIHPDSSQFVIHAVYTGGGLFSDDVDERFMVDIIYDPELQIGTVSIV